LVEDDGYLTWAGTQIDPQQQQRVPKRESAGSAPARRAFALRLEVAPRFLQQVPFLEQGLPQRRAGIAAVPEGEAGIPAV
jgi:hypothetical protein